MNIKYLVSLYCSLIGLSGYAQTWEAFGNSIKGDYMQDSVGRSFYRERISSEISLHFGRALNNLNDLPNKVMKSQLPIAIIDLEIKIKLKINKKVFHIFNDHCLIHA